MSLVSKAGSNALPLIEPALETKLMTQNTERTTAQVNGYTVPR